MGKPGINDLGTLGSHSTDSSYFIIGVVIAILLLALFLRKVLFHSSLKDYKHNPDD